MENLNPQENLNPFQLESQEKVKFKEVAQDLSSHLGNTPWSDKTNHLAIEYAESLNETYGDNWVKGKLPKELFDQIHLPFHNHTMHREAIALFEDDTTLDDVSSLFKDRDKGYSADCVDAILKLKNDIKINGFTSNLFLVVIGDKLKHVDGLHRMTALALLLDEGFEYPEISVFLCNNT